MNGDQLRFCILFADGIRIDLFGCRREIFNLLC